MGRADVMEPALQVFTRMCLCSSVAFSATSGGLRGVVLADARRATASGVEVARKLLAAVPVVVRVVEAHVRTRGVVLAGLSALVNVAASQVGGVVWEG
jgi:hypothetical protein